MKVPLYLMKTLKGGKLQALQYMKKIILLKPFDFFFYKSEGTFKKKTSLVKKDPVNQINKNNLKTKFEIQNYMLKLHIRAISGFLKASGILLKRINHNHSETIRIKKFNRPTYRQQKFE